MAKRSPEQVYAALVAAGWDPAAATVMTAIAGAESGWDNTAQGDLGLQTDTWGPSYGLFQIRTLKAQTGTGGPRDIARLAGDDIEQARAALVISQGGKDFTPWTAFTSGKYRAFLPGASTSSPSSTAASSSTSSFPRLGPSWLPWNWPAAGAEAVDKALGGARHIAVEASFVIFGLALVALGGVVLGRPAIARVWRRVKPI